MIEQWMERTNERTDERTKSKQTAHAKKESVPVINEEGASFVPKEFQPGSAIHISKEKKGGVSIVLVLTFKGCGQLWHKLCLHFFWPTFWPNVFLYCTYMGGEAPSISTIQNAMQSESWPKEMEP